ncbi:MAG: RdgB/HAM1 family non-canonical purine NTP pyrophosphatase [Verrucomicrobiota bacterium]
MQNLVLATRNPGKALELKELLGADWTVQTVTELSGLPEIDETGTTFHDNARLKSEGISACLDPQTLVLADDSGLEVDALDGEPGVYSARYAGADATDEANNAKLLRELEVAAARNELGRKARFRCVLSLAQGGKEIASFEGSCEGVIAPERCGEGGFGYDPLFLPQGHDRCFAQMNSAEKAALSHRGQALSKFQNWLKSRPAGGV